MAESPGHETAAEGELRVTAIFIALAISVIGGLIALELWGSVDLIAWWFIKLLTWPLEPRWRVLRRDELRALIPPCRGERRLAAAFRAIAISARLSGHDFVARRVRRPNVRWVGRVMSFVLVRPVRWTGRLLALTLVWPARLVARTVSAMFSTPWRAAVTSVAADIGLSFVSTTAVLVSVAVVEGVGVVTFFVVYLIVDPECHGEAFSSSADHEPHEDGTTRLAHARAGSPERQRH
jgi:hypothetical protein